jgi:hypothetical protein
MTTRSFFFRRTIRVGTNMTLELCVPMATAVGWSPDLEGNEPLLRAAAEGRAIREATGLINVRGTAPGRWRVTWTGAAAALTAIP